MEIHQEISKLVSDRLTDHVIDEYANEVAVTLLKNAIADQNNTRYETLLCFDYFMIVIYVCFVII
jgi:hypothetical protein